MRQMRLNEMHKYIVEKGAVDFNELCEKFKISINTARRDIDTLVSEGNVVKTYGGAAASKNNELVPYEKRFISNIDDKKKIAMYAAQFVEDGDILFLDSGTTVPLLLDYISDSINISVISASFDVLVRGVGKSNIDLYALSGKLNRSTNSFQEVGTSKLLMNYNITKALMAASGYSVSGGITTSAPWEYQIKKAVFSKDAKMYLMADITKFDKVKMFKYADASDVDCVITSDLPNKKYLDFFSDHNITLITPE